VADPDISFGVGGGHETPKAPREVGCSGSPLPRKFFQSFIKNGVFWSILMSKCASHVYTCIAYFHSHQYSLQVTTMLE